MESQEILSSNQPQGTLPNLPNATASLVLGIMSLFFCFFYGLPGLVLGIIGLVLSNKDRTMYRLNPNAYSQNSYNNSNAGRICSIIGIVLSLLLMLLVIGAIAFIGFNHDFFDGFKR